VRQAGHAVHCVLPSGPRPRYRRAVAEPRRAVQVQPMPTPTSSDPASAVPLSNDSEIDALLELVKWGGSLGSFANLTYSFPWATGGTASFAGYNGAPYSTLNEPATGGGALDPTQIAAVVSALQTWAHVANVTFSEVADTSSSVGDIRVAFTGTSELTINGTKAWGWGGYPNAFWPSAGDIWISTQSSGASDADWSVGSFNFLDLIHEIGHTLGLKHPFEGSVQLPAATNTKQYSVMSYTNPADSLFVRVTHEADGFHWHSFNVQPDTPMVLDVAAIQYLYGANTAYETGDNTYTFDPTQPFFHTIWDAGGNDTISVANFTLACTIDLRPGHYSNITIRSDPTAGINWNKEPPTPTYDGTGNLGIAYGTVIENAIGGGGSDVLIGNDVANTLQGGGGNDLLDGGAGIDTARYSGAAANFTWTGTAGGFSIADRTGAEGTDQLTSIERLQFADEHVALDLGGNAGLVAKILGAVFGSGAVHNATSVGIGLKLADAGWSEQSLVQAALGALPGGTPGNQQLVDLLYTNVIGTPPSPAQESPFVQLLQSGTYSQASLAAMAAETVQNAAHIGLVGLAASGLVYVAA
jgi:serralysin